MSESTSTTTALPYLNPTTGDLIIRTPDPESTDFHVHQCIIANLSPVFADMFSLPTAACGTTSPDKHKPVVDVQEPAAVWTHILSFCYFVPGPRPSSLTIDDTHALLEAGRKYQMTGVTDWMRRTLMDEFVDVDKQPLSAFGLACAYKLDDVARRAARASLFLPADFAFVKELDLIPTHQYHRLLEYRRRCLQAARGVLSWDGPSWLSDMLDMARYNRASRALRSLNKTSKFGPYVGGQYQINAAWRAGMEALCRNVETQLWASSTFCPLLLGPLVLACNPCNLTSTYGEPEEAHSIISRAHDFSLLLDAEIERVVNEVKLELDCDK